MYIHTMLRRPIGAARRRRRGDAAAEQHRRQRRRGARLAGGPRAPPPPVRLLPGRSSALGVFHSKINIVYRFCLGAQGASQTKTAVSGPGSWRGDAAAAAAPAAAPVPVPDAAKSAAPGTGGARRRVVDLAYSKAGSIKSQLEWCVSGLGIGPAPTLWGQSGLTSVFSVIFDIAVSYSG
jgi:hypothetical protein